MSQVRLVAFGSPLVGKSTLIGQLLKFGGPTENHPASPESREAIAGNYRPFSTVTRAFEVAEMSNSESSLPGLVATASAADAALLLVDAAGSLLPHTRRDGFLASLLGIRHLALVVNKLDLAGYSEKTFRDIEARWHELAPRIGITDITCIPVSVLKGDNVLATSTNTSWHRGMTLIGWLESLESEEQRAQRLPFRLPVQEIRQSEPESHDVAGTIAAGVVKPGDRVRIQPSGKTSRVARVATAAGDSQQAAAGQAIILSLPDAVALAPGDLISAADAPAQVADQFEATVVWLHEQPLLRGRTYTMQCGAKTVSATVAPLKYRINTDTLEHIAAEKLEMGDIGVCELELDQPIAFDPHTENRRTGGLILIDRETAQPVGLGMLCFALRRSHNIHLQHVDVDKAARAALKGQKSCVLWLTGLSGAGKSTVANLVEKKLHAMGRHTYILDGDNVRHGLTKDLGFTAADRVENIRRIAEVAKLMVDAGLIVLTAFISPFRAERHMARGLLKEGEYIEIFIDTTLDVAEQRDPKGLYKKARRGEIKNFTGIDSPYEQPEAPEIRIDTAVMSAEAAADRVIDELRQRGILKR